MGTFKAVVSCLNETAKATVQILPSSSNEMKDIKKGNEADAKDTPSLTAGEGNTVTAGDSPPGPSGCQSSHCRGDATTDRLISYRCTLELPDYFTACDRTHARKVLGSIWSPIK